MASTSSHMTDLLKRHQPSYVLVGPDHRVLEWSDGLGFAVFDRIAAGSSLLDLVVEDVKRPLQLALSRVARNGRSEDFLVVRPQSNWSGEIVVEPADELRQGQSRLMIILKPVAYPKARQTLRSEVQHRLRNTLAVIRSISRRTAETSQGKQAFASHLMGRIDAFARVIGLSMRSQDGSVLLEDLIREELLAQGSTIEQRVRMSGPTIALGTKAAETLALAVHELATNSVKFGAIGSRRGALTIAWERVEADEPGQLRIRWDEQVRGRRARPISDTPAHRGFGLELLENGMAYDLQARTGIVFRPEGVLCTMEIPLTPHVIN